MTDPYTEATRNDRRGMPTFLKVILVTGGLFAAAFVTLAVVGIIYARKMADEWVDYSETMFEDLELDATTAAAVANMAEAFIGDEVQITQADFDGSALTLRHSGQDGDFHIDLSDLEDWASDMETFLEREIENGVVIEGAGDESGGWLRVSRRNGRTILEMRGDEDGGTLSIRGPRTDTRIGLGDDANRIPNWVPVPPDASVRKHLFSGETDKATFGARRTQGRRGRQERLRLVHRQPPQRGVRRVEVADALGRPAEARQDPGPHGRPHAGPRSYSSWSRTTASAEARPC